MRIIDISQPVGPGIAVWPGDQPFELEWTLRQDRGDSVNVAALRLSAHTGTHTDGGFHVMQDGNRPFDMDLSAYMGGVTVVDARGIPLDERAIDDVDLKRARRILFRTRDEIDELVFPAHFHAPTPGLAKQLVAAGVRLIGSDTPSMDDAESKTLDSHRILARGRVATLENLDLTNAPPGEYTLIALPLKLREADSSPVRAVLIEGSIEEL
ncbi:MAG TPA: cyclase family protein [Longimicrobiales bacterium]|nr:cyclase family protein [Longimicrobiales bacterium]